ncbi:MAG: hypothetical protein GH143_08280 [Calditrichaeota bacterium]|nr:hypothetical protein [Calditrichota bacterium]
MAKLRRWSKREDILAVPDDHLDEWLTTIGLMSAIQMGEVACVVCGERIEKSNLQIVTRQEGKLMVICSNPQCMYQFLALKEGESK